MNIQWYPGHMAKTRRMIVEDLREVDAVCEIIDARIPVSSRNPDLDELIGGKPRLLIMNRVDQADPKITKLWSEHFKLLGLPVLETDCKSGAGVGKFSAAVGELLHGQIEKYAAKGQVGRALRAMIIGVPNVGKSSFINRAARRRAALAQDRPGVTRGKQWIKVDSGLELLDTPGILWPKFDDEQIGLNLAFTGAVKDDVMDIETLAVQLMSKLASDYPGALSARYKLDDISDVSGYELLETAAKKRGFLISGGEADIERMARVLLDEFRGGKLGRITLERPPQ